jgi:hypothetical protein
MVSGFEHTTCPFLRQYLLDYGIAEINFNSCMYRPREREKNIEWLKVSLWGWFFTVLRPAQEFFTYMETSPLPVHEELQNLGLYSALRAFEHAGRDLYRATPAVTRDLGFSGLIRRTAPFSRLFNTTHEGMWRIYSNPDPHGEVLNR